jgi:hypothetical protein
MPETPDMHDRERPAACPPIPPTFGVIVFRVASRMVLIAPVARELRSLWIEILISRETAKGAKRISPSVDASRDRSADRRRPFAIFAASRETSIRPAT